MFAFALALARVQAQSVHACLKLLARIVDGFERSVPCHEHVHVDVSVVVEA